MHSNWKAPATPPPIYRADNSRDLEEVDKLHRAAIARKSYADAIRRDDDFHRAICEISNMPLLWRAIDISKAQLDRCRHMAIPHAGAAEATLKQHRAIIDALAAGNPKTSREAMGRHLDLAYRNIVEFLDRQDGKKAVLRRAPPRSDPRV